MERCVSCGRPFLQNAIGRPRKRCKECAPPARRPDLIAPIIALSGPDRTDLNPLGSPESDNPGKPGRLTKVTSKVLTERDLLETTEGVRALQIAQLIDAGGYNATGAAALFRAHREAMEALPASTEADADVIERIFGTETG
jgi:hypothetical protein